MNTILPKESDLVLHFAEMTSGDLVHCEKTLREVIERAVEFYESVRVQGAGDQMLMATNFRRILLPEKYDNSFFDRRIDYPPSWKYHSEESYAFVEIRRYIQFDREENDTSLDCHLYFPLPVSAEKLSHAYCEVFEHERVFEKIEGFKQKPLIAQLLDQKPCRFLAFATIVW